MPLMYRLPRVSIGLPVFNGERYLKEALDSLLAQTYTDFDLIISDNASTDNTERICLDYVAKDRRVRYYRLEKNLGMAANYKRVFELRTGEYFKWAAADDVCMPDYLSRCVEVLDSDSSVVLVCAKAMYIDENGALLSKGAPAWSVQSDYPYERLRYIICVQSDAKVDAWSGVVRADALSKTRLIPSYPCGDKRALGELCLFGKFVEIPEYLYMRREHEGASSFNTANVEWMEHFFKANSVNVFLPTVRLCIDHFITVMHSKLFVTDKLSLALATLKVGYWSKNRVIKEIGAAAKYAVKAILFSHWRNPGLRW